MTTIIAMNGVRLTTPLYTAPLPCLALEITDDGQVRGLFIPFNPRQSTKLEWIQLDTVKRRTS